MDAGRSTLEHGKQVSTHVLEVLLNNWGACMASMSNPHALRSIKGCPVTSRHLSGYTDKHPRTSRAFNEGDAISFDAVIAASLDKRDIQVLVCAYVFQASSRAAARKLTMMQMECSHATYRRWLADAVQRLDEVVNGSL